MFKKLWKEKLFLGNDALTSLMTDVYGMAAWTNPLHPDAFPGIRKMEAEIVRMCCDLVSQLVAFRRTANPLI